ncbi:hypothetical protein IKG73_01855 [Candidatus Saccharibacteria bacterium]|nr:hypothetical protein [Candidatus Saccharibacteria bacterium]
MKDILTAIAVTLSILVSLGQLDPNMTVGELINLYGPQPQTTSVEREATEVVVPEVMENSIPKPTEEAPHIVINEPVVPEAIPTEPITPEVTLTIGESAVPEPVPTVEPVTPEVTLTIGDSSYSEADAKAIAKVMHAEAKGLNAVQKRAVGWCILNRVEDWGGTIRGVAESSAFVSSGSYTEEELALANEVLTSWTVDGPRDLPEGYYYFNGNGEQNFFRKELSGERLSLM